MPWNFTLAQAEQALQIALTLIKERRYFLHQQHSKYPHPGYNLDDPVFLRARHVNQLVDDLYLGTRFDAAENIRRGEKALGIVPPDLSNNRQLVQCNRYTGGLDIVGIYPMTNFADCVPESHQALEDELYQSILGGKSEDNYSANYLRDFRSLASAQANHTWSEIVELELMAENNISCMVMMQTRFNPSSFADDFMNGRAAHIQSPYSYAIGYLFWKKSQRERLIQHGYAVASTRRDGHVRIEHNSTDRQPQLLLNKTGGYDSEVLFLTIL